MWFKIILSVALAFAWALTLIYHCRRRYSERRWHLEATVGRTPPDPEALAREAAAQASRAVKFSLVLLGAPLLMLPLIPFEMAWITIACMSLIHLFAAVGTALAVLVFRGRLRLRREAELEEWMDDKDRVPSEQDWMVRDVAGMLVMRPTRRGEGVMRLLVAGVVVLFFANGLAGTLEYRLGTLDWGTSVYQRAQWASSVAVAAWLAAAGALAAWLLGTSLRLIFGLPTRRLGKLGWLFNTARAGLFLLLGPTLIVWGAEEMILRDMPNAPEKALGMGLLLCGLLAYDIPRLLRRGMACLRLRQPLVRTPMASLADLGEAGRFRLCGLVTALTPPPEGLPPGVVFRQWERLDADNKVLIKTQVVPFILADGGEQARVEAQADNLVVHCGDDKHRETAHTEDGHPATIVDIRDGDKVHLIADVHPSGGGPFRQGAASLDAASGPMLLFTRAEAMGRRLHIAGVVELVSAGALAVCMVGLVVFWAGVGLALP